RLAWPLLRENAAHYPRFAAQDQRRDAAIDETARIEPIRSTPRTAFAFFTLRDTIGSSPFDRSTDFSR
ncbi:hypothetical protein, partial [Burkholderia vietnamiensis]|uniref:hypothetical protein n=1 Tax=Burkholderia vietnamiensis TaxID=60552 RepID=UPI001ABA129B